MKKQEIAKILKDWYADELTCSGKPHCDVEECDLCYTCFMDLASRFGFKWTAVDLK